MTVKSILDAGRNKIFGDGGLTTTISIINFNLNPADYDDEVLYQSIAGSNVISGLVFPIRSRGGSEEALLLQQGKLLTKDKVLYTGSVNFSGNVLIDIKGEKYAIIPDGIHTYEANGSTIYSKIFIRTSLSGSLF